MDGFGRSKKKYYVIYLLKSGGQHNGGEEARTAGKKTHVSPSHQTESEGVEKNPRWARPGCSIEKGKQVVSSSTRTSFSRRKQLKGEQDALPSGKRAMTIPLPPAPEMRNPVRMTVKIWRTAVHQSVLVKRVSEP